MSASAAALAAGQLELRAIQPALDDLATARPALRRRGVLRASGDADERELERQQLLEGKAAGGPPAPVEHRRGNARPPRVGAVEQAAPAESQRAGSTSGGAARCPSGASRTRADGEPTVPRSPGRPAPGRSCDGRIASSSDQLVLLDAEGGAPATRLEPAAQQHLPALGQLIQQVLLVEPDGLERAGVVRNLALQQLQAPPSRRPHAAAAHRHRHRRLLADRELRHRPPPLVVAVIEGKVLSRSPSVSSPRRAAVRAVARPTPSRLSSGRSSRLGFGSERSSTALSSRLVCAAPLPNARGGFWRLDAMATRYGAAARHPRAADCYPAARAARAPPARRARRCRSERW